MARTVVDPGPSPMLGSGEPSHGIRAAALVGVLAGSLALGLIRLGTKSLWFDESISARIATMGTAKFVHTLWQDEANMSLYYTTLRGWVALGGDGGTWLRLLSVGEAVATVGVLYALARRLLGFRVAIAAAGILAVNAFFVEFAQEARSYMLTMLLLTIASYCFVRAVEEGGGRWWVGYSIASALAVYGQLFAIVFPAAHLCSLSLLPTRPRLRRRFAAAAGAMAVLVVPALRVAWVRRDSQVFWNPPVSLSRIVHVFAAEAGGGGPLLAAVVALLGAVATWAAFRTWAERHRSDETWRVGLAVLLFVVPTLAILVLSVAERIIQLRYHSLTLPALALAVAVGLDRLRGRRIRVAALALLVGLSGFGLARWYRGEKEDWRGALALVEAQGRPTDALLLVDPYRVSLVRYYHRPDPWHPARGPALDFPAESFDPFPLYRAPHPISTKELRAVTARERPIWVLRSVADVAVDTSALHRELRSAGYRTAEVRRLFRVIVEEWRPRGSGARGP